MGFNKRIFDMDLLVRRFKHNPETAIDEAIGKTDAFIFRDEESRKIVYLWLDGKETEANKRLETYVSGITVTAS